MKKTILAALLLLPALTFAQTKDKKIVIDDSGIGRQFPDCLLSGSVCNLFPSDKDPSTAAAFAYRTGDSSFTIELVKNSLSEEKQRAILGKLLREIKPTENVLFNMEIDFPVKNEFLDALDLEHSKKNIHKGKYPVIINDSHVLLHLTLDK